MSKKGKGTILFFAIMIAIIVLAWIGITILDGDSHYDSSLCTICHRNKKMEGKSYCYSCFIEAQQKVEEKNKNGTGNSIKPDPVKTSSDTSNSKTTNSSSNTSSSSSGKTTSGSSSKKEYNTLNYDPEDYDDPYEYADDAWDEDFDDYDEAYEYWEDY